MEKHDGSRQSGADLSIITGRADTRVSLSVENN